MTGSSSPEPAWRAHLRRTAATAWHVIVDPAGFFAAMPVEGGLGRPALFALQMGAVAGLVHAVVAVVMGVLPPPGALLLVLLLPLVYSLYTLMGGGILYAAWHMMGSKLPFEASYRCAAYMTAILPATAVLAPIPYVGPLVAAGWLLYLCVITSQTVHRVSVRTAWIVFGVLAGLLVLNAVTTQERFRRQLDEREAARTAERPNVDDPATAVEGDVDSAVDTMLNELPESITGD